MEKILTLNAGSSSIKFAIYDIENGALCETPSVRGSLNDLDSAPVFAVAYRQKQNRDQIRPETVCDYETAWSFLVGWLEDELSDAQILGAGHRVVHGGREYSGPVCLDEETLHKLSALSPLAPAHQPHNLAGVKAVSKLCPIARQVACFDTAFHRTQPRVEQIFALPRGFADQGIIRYGFHGLSYEYVAGALGDVLKAYPKDRVIVAHLGAGASMCAMKNGQSVATTMGFTALDGLPMATRCGAIDPGVVLHLLTEKGMTAAEVANCLYAQSGLLGISDISGDMRALQATDAPEAAEAIDYFVQRAVREIGSLAAAMGGLDALIFTAGIGENSPYIRERILNGAAWMGFRLDRAANNNGATRLTSEDSRPSGWVIATNEELVIARDTFLLINR